MTARKRSLGQGNIFTPVCHSVHRGGMRGCRGACMVAGGACVVAGGHAWLQGGHAWLPGGMCGCQGASVVARGACMVAGVCVHGCGGCVVVEGACIGYDQIWSMSGCYASYWNAFCLVGVFETASSRNLIQKCTVHVPKGSQCTSLASKVFSG